ncbi:hypothetical protein, partial [Nocardioides sp.]|uniref:hypothetical protein n=1 Tax=Nocardioides sp. TaxID=35761 RepID=UPI00286DF3BF
DDSDLHVSYGSWAGRSSATGTVRATSREDAQVGLTFTGTALTWVTTTGPGQGLARVEIDGATVTTVDNWTASTRRRVPRTFSGLAPGTHRVRIIVLGRHRPASTASELVIDAFVVS